MWIGIANRRKLRQSATVQCTFPTELVVLQYFMLMRSNLSESLGEWIEIGLRVIITFTVRNYSVIFMVIMGVLGEGN